MSGDQVMHGMVSTLRASVSGDQVKFVEKKLVSKTTQKKRVFLEYKIVQVTI